MAKTSSSPRLCYSPPAQSQLGRCSPDAAAYCGPSGYYSSCRQGSCAEGAPDVDVMDQIGEFRLVVEEDTEHICSEELGICACDGLRYPLTECTSRDFQKTDIYYF